MNKIGEEWIRKNRRKFCAKMYDRKVIGRGPDFERLLPVKTIQADNASDFL